MIINTYLDCAERLTRHSSHSCSALHQLCLWFMCRQSHQTSILACSPADLNEAVRLLFRSCTWIYLAKTLASLYIITSCFRAYHFLPTCVHVYMNSKKKMLIILVCYVSTITLPWMYNHTQLSVNRCSWKLVKGKTGRLIWFTTIVFVQQSLRHPFSGWLSSLPYFHHTPWDAPTPGCSHPVISLAVSQASSSSSSSAISTSCKHAPLPPQSQH